MYTGTIVTISSRGFGFIRPANCKPGDKDIFFHCSATATPGYFNELKVGQLVTYDLDTTSDARPRGVQVTPVA